MNDLTLFPWETPPRSPSISRLACYLEAETARDEARLPSGNCYNWAIKTDDVKWKPIFSWMNPHSAFIHTRRHDCDSPASWPWALCSAPVFALGGDRVTTVSQKKKEKKKGHFFAPSVKSTQIGLLDEWTCLCPFHAGCPFVMPPLLRKQQRWGLYLLSESSWCSSSLCWWGRVHLPSWISSRSLNNFYDWAWLTRKAEKPRLTFLWVWMFFNLMLSAGLLTSHHHFYPAPGGFSWLHRF